MNIADRIIRWLRNLRLGYHRRLLIKEIRTVQAEQDALDSMGRHSDADAMTSYLTECMIRLNQIDRELS